MATRKCPLIPIAICDKNPYNLDIIETRHGPNVLGTHVLNNKISVTHLMFFQGLVLVRILMTECTRTFHEYHTTTPYSIFTILFQSDAVMSSNAETYSYFLY